MTRVLRLLPLLAVVALVAACGSEKSGSEKPDQGRLSPQTSAAEPGPARSNEVAAAGLEGKAPAGNKPRGLRISAPCSLVSRAQAQAIVGGQITKPLEAPLGPTCIYRYGKHQVTLAVQPVDLKTLKRGLAKPQSVTVAKRDGVCGSKTRQALYLGVARGYVLSVGAPCPIAKQFAARALKTIGS
jgi:hypothetical protein